MRYLWEAALKALEERVSPGGLRFRHARNGSAYMELACPYLNQDSLMGESEIEVNTYYRYYSIFKDLFGPEEQEAAALREGLTNLILHMLAENDIRRGMSRDEYYKKLLVSDIQKDVYGQNIKDVFREMEREGQDTLLNGLIRSFRTGSSLIIFADMIRDLIPDSIVYRSRENPDEIIVYTGQVRTYALEQRMDLIKELFLDIRYRLEIFYGMHFGILGLNQTMRMDEIAMY